MIEHLKKIISIQKRLEDYAFLLESLIEEYKYSEAWKEAVLIWKEAEKEILQKLEVLDAILNNLEKEYHDKSSI